MCEKAIATVMSGGTAVTGQPKSALGRWSLLPACAVLLLFLSVDRASAAPPTGAALTYQQWFESLEQPGGRHLPCCSIADCHFAIARMTTVGYEVAIENSWVPVPSDRILERVSNPTGRAIVCYRHVLDLDQDQIEVVRIFCFVRPPDV